MFVYNLEQQVLDLRASGYTYTRIALQLAISKSKVQRIIEKLNKSKPLEFHCSFCKEQLSENQIINKRSQMPVPPIVKTLGFRAKEKSNSFRSTRGLNPKKFSFEEAENLFKGIAFFQQDYIEFVSKMFNLHYGQDSAAVKDYYNYARKALLLKQWARGLAREAGLKQGNLLVMAVLDSIYQTIINIITGKDKVEVQHGCYHLRDKIRSLRFWLESITVHILTPYVDPK